MIPKARAMKEETPMSGQEATAVLQERPCGEGEDEPPTERSRPVGPWRRAHTQNSESSQSSCEMGKRYERPLMKKDTRWQVSTEKMFSITGH